MRGRNGLTVFGIFSKMLETSGDRRFRVNIELNGGFRLIKLNGMRMYNITNKYQFLLLML